MAVSEGVHRADAPLALMPPATLSPSWARLWVRLAAQGTLLVGGVFLAYELAEHTLLAAAAPATLHALHLARGLGTAFLLATWSFLEVRRARLARDRRLTEELTELDAQLRHQERMAALGILAAGFAHDVGNPLASIRSELELLEGEGDIERYQESLAVLQRHVGRMSRTLREMVDLARRQPDEKSEASVADAVAEASRLVAHDPRWRTVRLAVDVPQGLPRARVAPDDLVLVLVNLLLNALDAMPEGGRIDVCAGREGPRLALQVRDTGKGMTPDVLAQAQRPLFTTKARGTGLGLSVSARVLAAAGGELRLASHPGQGTLVTLFLCEAGGTDA